MGMIFIIIGIVVIFVVLAEGGAVFHTSGRTVQTIEEGPLDVLRKRYARGEIDRNEFEQRRRDLVS